MRPYDPADAKLVKEINAECVPEVGEMDDAKLALLSAEASFFCVVESDDRVVGFLIGLDETSEKYGSPNYAWFRDRYESMAYVDRIALTESARGQGHGQRLYAAFQARAVTEGKSVITAEVNTIPDNPASHAFHERFGFREVARCRPYGPDEEVAMYVKSLKP